MSALMEGNSKQAWQKHELQQATRLSGHDFAASLVVSNLERLTMQATMLSCVLGLMVAPHYRTDCFDIQAFWAAKDFDVQEFVGAVNYYVAKGEAVFAADCHKNETSMSAYMLMRVLFVPKPNGNLRPPGLGAYLLPYDSMPPNDWPLFPMVKSGASYFVLGNIRYPASKGESVVDYLKFCQKEGHFIKESLPVPSFEESTKDLSDLLQSAKWKAIEWESKTPGLYYKISELIIVNGLRKQILKHTK